MGNIPRNAYRAVIASRHQVALAMRPEGPGHRKRQTRREAGTQSHGTGPLGGLRQSAGLPEVFAMPFWTGTEWAAEPSVAPEGQRRLRHALEAALEGTLVALVIVGILAGTTLASTKTASSVWIEGSSTLRASSGLTFGDAFTVGYSTSAREPWAHAVCYPVDTTVYRETYGDGWIWGQYFSVYPGGPQPQAFQLVDPVADNWTGGGARCTLELIKLSSSGRETMLAKDTFSVAP
jgi:hypothetical protein